MLANGLCWNVLRIERGKWRSVDSKFNRWPRGVRTELFEQLKRSVKGIDFESIMADFAAVGNHRSAMGSKGGNQCICRTSGGSTTKLSVIVDARGNPLGFTVTAGNVRDSKESRSLIQILEEIFFPSRRA